MNRKHIFTAALVGILTVFIGYFFFAPQVLNVGTELPDAPALFETSLAAPITATANSMTLTSNSVRGGGSLSGYNCFTIDEGSAQAEFVCGTASSTSVTGLVRGISPSDGVTADTDLQFSHRRGASVKITDFPIVQILRNQNNGDATFENVLRYAAAVVPTGASDLADVGYVLSVVNGGSVNFDALVVAGTAGETVATGTVVYFDGTDQEWKKVDTDTSATYQAVPVGITQGSGVNGGTIGNGGVLLAGLDETQTNMTVGSTYYASTTAGGIGKTATGLRLGKAKSATQLYVVPVVDLTMTNNTWSGTNTFSGTVSGTSKVTVFDASGTWTKTGTPARICVEAWGAGGSGGKDADSAAAGGGGGTYIFKCWANADLASPQTVTIGAGGTAISVDNTAGNSGGNTTFGSLLTAYAGAGGSTIFASNPARGGGGGGIFGAGSGGTGGAFGGATSPAASFGTALYPTLSEGGGHGGSTDNTTAGPGGNAAYGGAGGGSHRSAGNNGAGGTSIYGGNGGTGGTTGTAGSVPGGGGGGSSSGNSGAGAAGRVVVTELY